MSGKNPDRSPPRPRLIPRGPRDTVRIRTVGRRRAILTDNYAKLLAARWGTLMALIVLVYVVINIVFAAAYIVTGPCIENARPGSWLDPFFFSVQTFATIGYGKMLPSGDAANVIVTVEAIAGFIYFAMATGLLFSKFSRPTSRVLFSNVAVIAQYDGQPHLMLRLANERGNRIVDAEVAMTLLKNTVSPEGHRMRRFYDMKLARDRAPLLQLSWTLLHPINAASPLYGMTGADIAADEAEVIVALTGLDETLSQTIHARFSYRCDEILRDAVFEDVLHVLPDGTIEMLYSGFHATRDAADGSRVGGSVGAAAGQQDERRLNQDDEIAP